MRIDMFDYQEEDEVIFWKRFPMDYARDTAHLSLSEHGAYALLLDAYYSTGRPLPGPIAALMRLCRATTPTERKAVENVAESFFPVCEDGLRHNEQADRDLVEYNERVEFNRRVGALGGRPRKSGDNPDANPSGIPTANPNANPNGYPQITLLQKSEVRSQKLEKSVGTARAVPARPTLEEVRSYCVERRNAVDPEKWFDHYTANGFRIGKNVMKDWRAAVRTWERNEVGRAPELAPPKPRSCTSCDAVGTSLVETHLGPLCPACYRVKA
jgi:uncharacterized protein YdaU (DUF1376 family)